MSDLIDRAEAQTEIQFAARRYTVAHEAHGEGRVVWSDSLISVEDAMNALRKVPSARPESTMGQANETDQSANDCISRQAAIDSFRYDDDGTAWNMDDIVYRLEQFPSVQPERKTGEWITHYYKLGTERYECNVCHNRIGDTPYYCPNCGADMRGEQDE